MNNSKEHSMYVFPTVSFFSRPTRGKKEKHLLIYMRISLHGNSRDVSLNQKINLGQWDVHKQQVKGNSENSRMINQLLVDMKNKVFKLQMKYSQSEELLSLEEIVQTIKGKTSKGKTIILPESWTRSLVKKSLNLTKQYDQTNPTQIHA